jgi:hypothetical protein
MRISERKLGAFPLHLKNTYSLQSLISVRTSVQNNSNLDNYYGSDGVLLFGETMRFII